MLEYRGEAIEALSMEARMTICNMSIEAGARAGMIAPDETTFEYLKGRPHSPQGQDWDDAVEYWKSLRTDDGAQFDAEITIDADELEPFVWHQPWPGVFRQKRYLDQKISMIHRIRLLQNVHWNTWAEAGTPMKDITVDTVFLGSCTNARIEDLRMAAAVIRGREKRKRSLMVVPGSMQVRLQAEEEGLDKIFKNLAQTGVCGAARCAEG